MLFTKKNRIYAEDCQIKEEFKNPEGEVLLKINLRFPNIRCPRNHPLEKDAVKFYKKLREGFEGYCKTELLNIAKEAKKANPEGFSPFSALVRWENTLDNEKFLSLVLDFSVSDGISQPDTERKTQIWEKETGRLCSFADFFPKEQDKKAFREALGEENKKRFSKELFALRENSFEFYLKSENGFEKFLFPRL